MLSQLKASILGPELDRREQAAVLAPQGRQLGSGRSSGLGLRKPEGDPWLCLSQLEAAGNSLNPGV